MGIVPHIAEGALNLRYYCVVGAVDAIRDSSVAGGAGVGVEIVLPITDVAGRWNCTGGAEGSGAVGVGLRNVETGFAVGEAEQEDQCNKYLGVHIRIIQQIGGQWIYRAFTYLLG